MATREGPAWPHGRDLHGHTVETCMATQERPAWPHRDKNGLHGHTTTRKPREARKQRKGDDRQTGNIEGKRSE